LEAIDEALLPLDEMDDLTEMMTRTTRSTAAPPAAGILQRIEWTLAEFDQSGVEALGRVLAIGARPRGAAGHEISDAGRRRRFLSPTVADL